jgi:F-type H+-transporting ATPase subunit c
LGIAQGELSVKKYATLVAAFLAVLVLASTAYAQQPGPTAPNQILDSKFIGAGLITIGGGYGIGRLASSALESMARQPEVAGSVQTAMIIAAALIEGFTFFALVICFMG